MDITLKPEQVEWIEKKLKTGKYKTVEEIIGTALYLLEERDEDEEWVEELQTKVKQAITSLDQGKGLDGETAIAQLLEELDQKYGDQQ